MRAKEILCFLPSFLSESKNRFLCTGTGGRSCPVVAMNADLLEPPPAALSSSCVTESTLCLPLGQANCSLYSVLPRESFTGIPTVSRSPWFGQLLINWKPKNQTNESHITDTCFTLWSRKTETHDFSKCTKILRRVFTITVVKRNHNAAWSTLEGGWEGKYRKNGNGKKFKKKVVHRQQLFEYKPNTFWSILRKGSRL